MSEQAKFSDLAQTIEAADKEIQKKVDNVNERALTQKVQKLEAKINSSNPTVKNKYADKLRELSGKFDDLEAGEAKEHVSKLNQTVRATLTALNHIAKENGFPELAINVDRAMADATGQLTLEKWTKPPDQNGYNDISTIFKKHFGLSPRPSNPNFRRYTVHLVNQKLEANRQALFNPESHADFKKALEYIRRDFHPGDKFDLNKVKANMAKNYMDFSGHSGNWKQPRKPSKSQPKKPSAPKYAPTNLTASATSAREKVKQEEQFAKEFNTHRQATKQNMADFYKNLFLAQTTKDKTKKLASAKAMNQHLSKLNQTAASLQSLRFKLEKADIYPELNQKVQQLQVRLEMMFVKLELNRQFNKAKSRSDAARKNTKSYLSALNLNNLIPKLYRNVSGDKNTLTYDEAKLRVYQNVTDQQQQKVSGAVLGEYLLQKFKNNWNQVRRLGPKAFNQLAGSDQKFANLLSQIKIKAEPRKGENAQQARLRTAYMALKSFTYSSAGQRLSAINRGPQNPNTKEGLDAYKSRLQKIAYREAKNMEFQYGPHGASFSYPLYVKAIKLYPNSPLAKKMQSHIKSWAKWWERTYSGVSDVCHELSNASAVIAPGVGKVIGIGLSKLPGAVRLATLAKTGWLAAENAGKFGKVFQAFRVLAAGNPANLARLQAAASNGRFMLFGKGLARFSLSLGASLGRITALAGMSETVYKGSGRYIVTAAFGVPALMRGFSNRLTSAVSQDLAKSWMKNATTNPQANTNLMNAYFMHIQKTYTQEAFQKQIAPKLVAQLESQGIKNAEQQVQKFTNYLFSEGGKKSIQEAAKNNPIAKKLFESKAAPTLVIKTPKLTRQVNQLEKEFDQFFKFVGSLPKSQSLNETLYTKSITEFFKKIRSVKEWNQSTFNQVAQEFNELAMKSEGLLAAQDRGKAIAPLQKTLDFLLTFKNRLNTSIIDKTGKYLQDVAQSSLRLRNAKNLPTTLKKSTNRQPLQVPDGRRLKSKNKNLPTPSQSNSKQTRTYGRAASAPTIQVQGLQSPQSGKSLITAAQKEVDELYKFLNRDIKLNPSGTSPIFKKNLDNIINQLSSATELNPAQLTAIIKSLNELAAKIETNIPLAFREYAIVPIQKIVSKVKLAHLSASQNKILRDLDRTLTILRDRAKGPTSRYGQPFTKSIPNPDQIKPKPVQGNTGDQLKSFKEAQAEFRRLIGLPVQQKTQTRNIIKPAATQKSTKNPAPKAASTPKQTVKIKPLEGAPRFSQEIQKDMNTFFSDVAKEMSKSPLNQVKRYIPTIKTFMDRFGRINSWTQETFTSATKSLETILSNLKLPFSLREAAAKPFRKIHTLMKSVQESQKFKSPEIKKSLDRSDAWLNNLEQQAKNYNRFPVWQQTFRRQRKQNNKKAS